MRALLSADDRPVLDPDTMTVPEASAHRHAIDLIGLAASCALGDGWRIFRNLNWYPRDGGGPVAPNLMVLPAGATEQFPVAYRQDETGGPVPAAVVEIPSEHDSFAAFRARAFRYQRLGTVVFLVVLDGRQAVLRLGADDREPVPWAGTPIGELGGLSLSFEAGGLTVTLPSGTRATSDAELLSETEARAASDAAARAAEAEAQATGAAARVAEAEARAAEAEGRAAEAEGRAADAEARATDAEARAAVLAEQLRALGVEPEAGPSPGTS